MRFGLLSVLALCFAFACTEPPTPPPPEAEAPIGTLNGACASGGFCNDGLVCFNEVCVVDTAGGEGEGEEGEGEGEGEECEDADDDGSCVDDDCDDRDPTRFPGNPERCDDVDQDCTNTQNNGLDCSFLAHTRDTLFKIDPFAGTFTELREVTLIDNAALLDIDTDVDGTLLAATGDGIFEIESNGSLTTVANVAAPDNTNGICITGEGTMFLTNNDQDNAADSAAWRVQGNQIVEVGGFSNGLVSSGDCVVTKEEDVLMSAKDPDEPNDPDLLVLVDSATGATSNIGSIGFARVFGLSASFGFLYGVTSEGQVLEINRNTGAGTLLFTATQGGDPVRFNGAANGD